MKLTTINPFDSRIGVADTKRTTKTTKESFNASPFDLGIPSWSSRLRGGSL